MPTKRQTSNKNAVEISKSHANETRKTQKKCGLTRQSHRTKYANHPENQQKKAELPLENQRRNMHTAHMTKIKIKFLHQALVPVNAGKNHLLWMPGQKLTTRDAAGRLRRVELVSEPYPFCGDQICSAVDCFTGKRCWVTTQTINQG
jgi:hypothetical protein